MPWLTTEGASHQIAEGETVVGSGANTGWRLASQELAARHFVIERRGTRVTIRPCGVDAVIAVNGAQSGAQPRDLKDGDTIDAGNARFRYSGERSGSYPAMPVGPAHLLETRRGVAHDLAAASIGIGRDRLNAIVVHDPTASRFHAEIRREAGGFVLHPQGSSGTLLNGRSVGSPERLRNGDLIEIANLEMRFVAGPVPSGAATPDSVPDPDEESGRRPTIMGAPAIEIPDEALGKPKWLLWLAIAALTLFGFLGAYLFSS
jgi:predicted component of type VI protein secretion system